MRNIITVIDQISALLPAPAPPAVADELTILAAELRVLKRTAQYYPAEADPSNLWNRLGTTLYRYLPNPSSFDWAEAISKAVTGQ